MLSIYEYWECACYILWNGSVCHYNHFIYMVCVSELSFNSGDEILVVGFKDGAGRWRPVSVIVRSYDIAIENMVVMALRCHLEVNQLSFCSSLRVCMHRSPLTPLQNGKNH